MIVKAPLNYRYFFVRKFIEVAYYAPPPKENLESSPAPRKLSFPLKFSMWKTPQQKIHRTHPPEKNLRTFQ